MDPLKLPAIIKEAMTKAWRDTIQEDGGRIANLYKRAVQQRIYLQLQPKNAPWPPLNEDYAEMKRRKRLDPRMLIATGEYVSKIYAKKVDGETWQVTVPIGIHGPSKLPYAAIRAIHEFGAGRVPPRPHWQPTTTEFENNKQQYGADIQQNVNRKARKIVQALIQRGRV